MPFSFAFLNDLKNSSVCEWPGIVRKHRLTPKQVERVNILIKGGWLEDCWLNALCIECFGCGIYEAYKVFNKYNIPEAVRPSIKQELIKRHYNDDKSWKYRDF